MLLHEVEAPLPDQPLSNPIAEVIDNIEEQREAFLNKIGDDFEMNSFEHFGNTTQFNNIEVDPSLFPDSGKKKWKKKNKKKKKKTDDLHDPRYEEIMREVEKTEAQLEQGDENEL